MEREGGAAEYCRMLRESEKAVPFMKASYHARCCAPAILLPPEILELLYMYCAAGSLKVGEVRKLYPAAVLHGMERLTDREIVHGAVEEGLEANLLKLRICD
tara:strand:- start:35 stop:340 length:306 start_codon:yes stop_codon:yes gene_type:complete